MRRPLSVVGTDQEALRALISLHACPEPRILDVTHNRGRMWKGLPYTPHRSDRDPCLHEQGFTDTVADFRALPFPDASFDVIVFDPPHIGDADESVMGGQSFGVDAADMRLGWKSVPAQFSPFMCEARRVLRPRVGVVIAKICDQVTAGRYRFQHLDLIGAGRLHGMTACDVMLTVQWARGGLIDPKWKHVNHVRQVHTYWLAFRNGPDCISPTAPRADVKPRTTEMFA
jgi:hypothetical protein